MSENTINNLSWYVVEVPNAGEAIAIITDAGAMMAHGPFLDYPVKIIRPATGEEAAWANEQMDIRQEQLDAQEEARNAYMLGDE